MDQYACLFIDATWRDMLAAFSYTGQTRDRAGITRDVEGLFGGSDKCLACFSVRSALDLFLSVMQFPHGSEILMTAINIPDIVTIIEYHRLTIVPVDVNVETLSPSYEHMAALVTERTVAVICAHIYGRWTMMDDIVRIAREKNLLILEDCAECFSGFSNLGHPQADVSFFSFGAIKYATAMGGAVARLKDPDILASMRSKMDTYPLFMESSFLERLFRYSFVMFFVNNPLVMKMFSNCAYLFGVQYSEFGVSLLRGFSVDVITKSRYQPSTSILRLMLRRLQHFDAKDHAAKANTSGDFVLKTLSESFLIPGSKANTLNYWLFPILVDDPQEWVKELAKEKIWCYFGVTQLDLVKPNRQSQKEPSMSPDVAEDAHLCPESKQFTETRDVDRRCTKKVFEDFGCIPHDHTELYPHEAKFLMDHVLYLPVHKRVQFKDLEQLCEGVLNVARRRHPGIVSSKELLMSQWKLKSRL